MPGFIAIVYRHVKNVGFVARDFDDFRAHAFQIGEISSSRNVLARGRRIRRIDRVDEIVFVAGFVLDKKNVLAVAAPEVRWNWARGVRGNRLCLVERFFGALDPDVARAFERLNKSDELAIGRNLPSGDLRVPEEEFAIDYRWQTILLSLSRS